MNILRSVVGVALLTNVVAAQEVHPSVIVSTDAASAGYTLIAPFGGQNTFLIDLNGHVVHSWTTERKPSQAAYLLEDGCLLRTAKIPNDTFNVPGGPAGGIQKFDWDGNLIWDYVIADDRRLAHHDIEPLPNGNVLVVAWELKTREESLAAGRDPDTMTDGVLWSEVVLEIQPQGATGGRVVWEWHLWDHLVQSFDRDQSNFGHPAEHPELIDLNFVERPIADWIHMNSIDYSPQLDQILMSGRTFDEIWIIDHGTTTEEAASHTGGRYGKGGDLLYRWGNPFAWFAGTPLDQKLFGQHDPQWIPPDAPGGGNILVFNNGHIRDQRPFSSVDELSSVAVDGKYTLAPDGVYGPIDLEWSYSDPDRFFSQRVSGAQRLPNGNTLICSGEQARVFEVTGAGDVVWDFHNYLGANASAEPAAADSVKPPTTQGPLGGVAMFRAVRYPPTYPAFRGRQLNVIKQQ